MTAHKREKMVVTDVHKRWMTEQAARFCAESQSIYTFKPAWQRDGRLYVWLLKDGERVDQYSLDRTGEVYYDEDPFLNYKFKLYFRRLNRQAIERSPTGSIAKDHDWARGIQKTDVINIPLAELENEQQ